MIPLWKDVQYTTSGDSFVFRIKIYDYATSGWGETLYEGLAYPYPNGSIVLDITEICRDLMDTSPDTFSGGIIKFRSYADGTEGIPQLLNPEPAATRKFGLFKVENDSLGEETEVFLDDYEYIRIWDRDIDEFSSEKILSLPINGRFDPRMLILYTEYNPSAGTIDIEVQ